MKLSKFWCYIAQKIRRIWQYPFVEQNVVVFWICVSNISKIHWSLRKILVIKETHVWNHFSHFREMLFMCVVLLGSKLYWPRYMPSLSGSVISLNVIAVVVLLVKNYTLTSKHRNLIVITTTEQYFSPLPEKYFLHQFLCSVNNNSSACYHEHNLISHIILVSILYTHKQNIKCWYSK